MCADNRFVVDADEIEVSYRNKAVLRGITLRLERGQILGLSGSNGSGKTTFLRAVAGLCPLSNGSLHVLGRQWKHDRRFLRARIGYVPEQQFFYQWMTVAQILRFCSGVIREWDANLCNDQFQSLGLDAKKRVDALSHGMRVKLSVLIAISHKPSLLLLDEATNGLDAETREDVLKFVKDFAKRYGSTGIFCSHRADDIRLVSDTMARFEDGLLEESNVPV